MGLWSRWKRTFHAEQHEQEIEEELRYHLAMREQEGIEQRAARLQFGNRTKWKEQVRAEGVLPWLESFGRDVRYALRQVRKAPLFTLVLVFSLALGIGANSAIFSLVDAALLKSLPVRSPESLRLVEWTNHGFPGDFCHMMTGDSEGDEKHMQGSSIAARVYRQLAQQQYGFASLIGFSDSSMVAMVVNKRAAEQIQLQYVSANFFAGLGVPLQLGRPFSTNDDRIGQPLLVILSDRFWHSHLAARPDVLGQVLRINNVPVEIAGVAQPGFFGLQIGGWVDLYAPLAAETALSSRAKLDPGFSNTDFYWWVRMMGRLKPGIPENKARQELSALFRGIVVPAGVHVEDSKIPSLTTLPGGRGVDPMRTDQSRALWILFLLVGLILLIVCANVANLLLSRAIVRQRESAVCLALGAARFRLFRQYLTESLLLAIMGGAAGLLLGYFLANALHAFIGADLDIGGFDLHASAPVLGFTCVVSLLTAVLCGIAPAWTMVRTSINHALKANSRMVATGKLRLPRLLVIAQIALSFAVLVAAGLLSRSLANLRQVDVGFNRANLIYASVNPWDAGYQPEQVNTYAERLRGALGAVPGVLWVSMVESRPLSGDWNVSVVNFPGRPSNGSEQVATINHVSDGFFETLGVPLVAGRTFAPRDMDKDSDAVIVDDLFVRRFYEGRNALEEQFSTGRGQANRYRIIGVVKNSRHHSLRESSRPTMFRPYAAASRPGWRVSFVLRTTLNTGQFSRTFRQVASAIDPGVPVIAIETQTELIDALLRSERLLSIFSSAFGFLALALSGIGLLGLLAYMVARRKNEIGVRMALGASRHQVAGMVVRDAFVLLSVGLATGLPIAVLLGQMLKHTLFNLHSFGLVTGLFALAIMILITGLSSWIPASRAARIEPITALREE